MRKLALLLICALLGGACAPTERKLTRTEYAYQLLDQGRNAEAILPLEEELKANPGSDEARTLLGSALVGQSGVNIYSIYDNFQDLLFKRSLKDSVIDPKPESAEGKPLRTDLPKKDSETSGAERSIHKLDRLMVGVQNAVMYLNRFPQVPREKWPLLEEALEHLERVEQATDLCVYRVFIRITYIKSFLVEEVFRDGEPGTREWACRLSMGRARPGIDFVNGQVQKIFEDVDLAVKMGSKRFTQARNGLAFLSDLTALSQGVTEVENSATYDLFQRLVKERFGCDNF